MTILEQFFEDLNLDEAVKVSLVRRNKMDKRAAFASRSALSICQDENPALYQKYHMYREKYLLTREQIYRKYKQRGRINARKQMA